MPTLNCPIDQCPFATPDIDMAGAVAILTIHGSVHQNAPQQPVAHVARAPRLDWTTEDAVAFMLESDFSDAESTWGMETDEEELLVVLFLLRPTIAPTCNVLI